MQGLLLGLRDHRHYFEKSEINGEGLKKPSLFIFCLFSFFYFFAFFSLFCNFGSLAKNVEKLKTN